MSSKENIASSWRFLPLKKGAAKTIRGCSARRTTNCKYNRIAPHKHVSTLRVNRATRDPHIQNTTAYKPVAQPHARRSRSRLSFAATPRARAVANRVVKSNRVWQGQTFFHLRQSITDSMNNSIRIRPGLCPSISRPIVSPSSLLSRIAIYRLNQSYRDPGVWTILAATSLPRPRLRFSEGHMRLYPEGNRSFEDHHTVCAYVLRNRQEAPCATL
jgi:hypothetical protein